MTRMLLGLGVSLCCFWQHVVQPADARILGPLRKAGVDVRDPVALIGALHQSDDDPRLATAAAYALGNVPGTPAVVRELNRAARNQDEILMNYAIRSLLKHGDRQWILAAAARLRNVRDARQRLHLAGELARAGRYEGWDLLEAAIIGGEPAKLETALLEVRSFGGMKDVSGKRVDLLSKLDELRRRAPESARPSITQAIVRIGAEEIPELRKTVEERKGLPATPGM